MLCALGTAERNSTVWCYLKPHLTSIPVPGLFLLNLFFFISCSSHSCNSLSSANVNGAGFTVYACRFEHSRPGKAYNVYRDAAADTSIRVTGPCAFFFRNGNATTLYGIRIPSLFGILIHGNRPIWLETFPSPRRQRTGGG